MKVLITSIVVALGSAITAVAASSEPLRGSGDLLTGQALAGGSFTMVRQVPADGTYKTVVLSDSFTVSATEALEATTTVASTEKDTLAGGDLTTVHQVPADETFKTVAVPESSTHSSTEAPQVTAAARCFIISKSSSGVLEATAAVTYITDCPTYPHSSADLVI
jgi:hypothetical protein